MDTTDSNISSSTAISIQNQKAPALLYRYIHIGLILFLHLFTFGIYPLIWCYKTTGFLLQFSNDGQNSTLSDFLLVLFLPFYNIYWHYKYARIVRNETMRRGVTVEDFSTLHLLLSIFAPIVAVMMLQSRINDLPALPNN